ncbi:MAG: RIP metalloprotease RseP [Proteobacteria bacterium]|nr:RIP metalloprotease RseP [Pseudomonadota bacterium]
MLTIISTIIVLGALIFAHELGHFLAAKGLGVRVERFSLGFPPKMIGKQVGETEYILSWIPLGGYVKMFGENPDEEVSPEEAHRSFSHKPAWARFLIVFAGPGFNFVFAILAFWLMFTFSGIPQMKAVIGRVEPAGPAAEAGIQDGDEVIAMAGEPIRFWSQIMDRIEDSGGRALEFTVQRDGRKIMASVKPRLIPETTIFGDEIQVFDIGIKPYLSAVVGAVKPDSPAARAGLQPGDRIVSLDDRPIKDWYDLLNIIQNGGGKPLSLTALRQGTRVVVQVTPEMVTLTGVTGEETRVPRIGIERQAELIDEDIGPITSLYYGVDRTWQLARLTVISVVKLIQRKISPKTLGGPIFIAQLTGQQAKAGLIPLLSLAALLSINLGILNLLPIPVLDGGHLFFFALEMVFRRPVSLNIRERAQQVGLVFLILFMAFIFYNDLARIFGTPDTPEATAPPARQSESPRPGHGDPGR